VQSPEFKPVPQKILLQSDDFLYILKLPFKKIFGRTGV
jgi:hypothetical protein